MITLIQKVVKDCLTLANGSDYDIGRIAGAAGVIVFFGLAIADFLMNKKFDPQAFGMGFGLIIAGLGAALALKHKTEPQDGEGHQ